MPIGTSLFLYGNLHIAVSAVRTLQTGRAGVPARDQRTDQEGKSGDEQIHRDEVPQERRERLTCCRIAQKPIGRKEGDEGEQAGKVFVGMEEPARIAGGEHLPQIAPRPLNDPDHDVVEGHEDEGEKEQKGELPEVFPCRSVQAEKGDEKGGGKEQPVTNIEAKYFPLPQRLSDIPIGKRHRDDARIDAEEDEEVLSDGAVSEQNNGGGEDEQSAQIVRRTEAKVKFGAAIGGVEKSFQDVLCDVDEHEGKNGVFFRLLRAITQKKIERRRDQHDDDRVEEIGKLPYCMIIERLLAPIWGDLNGKT